MTNFPLAYYGDELGMTGAGDPDNRRDMRFDDELSEVEGGVLRNFEKLTQIRNNHPALRNGSRRVIVAEKDRLAFVRAQFEDRVLCVFNRGTQPMERELEVGPELADGAYADELNGTAASAENGRMKVTVAPHTAAFFVRANAP